MEGELQIQLVKKLERAHLFSAEVHQEELAVLDHAGTLEAFAGRADEENGLPLVELDHMDRGIGLDRDDACAELAGDGLE